MELPPAALASLGRRLRLPGLPVVRDRWVGATSTVLRLDTDLCVKVPHADPTAVGSCLTHAHIAPVARRLGVSAPEILTVEELADVPVPVVVSRFLHGRTLSRATDGAAVWWAVGAELARLHAARREDVAVEPRSFTQHDEVDPARLATDARNAGRISPATAQHVEVLRERLATDVLPDDRPVLCHGDLHTENVVVDAGRYAGLLDFAGAGWLDAAWDFAAIPLPAVAPCLDGYARGGGATDRLVPRIAWCRLQLALHRLPASAAPQAEAEHAVDQARRLLRGAPA